MRHPRLALLCALFALSCVGTEVPRPAPRPQAVCDEAVALDARGDPRNAEGRIRQCWPGARGCHCDGDGDCYARDVYVPCTPRPPNAQASVLAQRRLPADARGPSLASMRLR